MLAIKRIEPPAPMADDHDKQVASGNAWVLELGGEVLGLVVLITKPGYMLIDNIAVLPERQRSGLGRILMAFAEASARERGYVEVRLYTNELMHEKRTLQPSFRDGLPNRMSNLITEKGVSELLLTDGPPATLLLARFPCRVSYKTRALPFA